jgi:hypothetical protein
MVDSGFYTFAISGIDSGFYIFVISGNAKYNAAL